MNVVFRPLKINNKPYLELSIFLEHFVSCNNNYYIEIKTNTFFTNKNHQHCSVHLNSQNTHNSS